MDLLTIVGVASAVILPSVGFIVWLVHLEGKTNAAMDLAKEAKSDLRNFAVENKADLKEFVQEVREAQKDISTKMGHLETELSKIRGMLEPRREFKPS